MLVSPASMLGHTMPHTSLTGGHLRSVNIQNNFFYKTPFTKTLNMTGKGETFYFLFFFFIGALVSGFNIIQCLPYFLVLTLLNLIAVRLGTLVQYKLNYF